MHVHDGKHAGHMLAGHIRINVRQGTNQLQRKKKCYLLLSNFINHPAVAMIMCRYHGVQIQISSLIPMGVVVQA